MQRHSPALAAASRGGQTTGVQVDVVDTEGKVQRQLLATNWAVASDGTAPLMRTITVDVLDPFDDLDDEALPFGTRLQLHRWVRLPGVGLHTAHHYSADTWGGVLTSMKIDPDGSLTLGD